MANIKVSEMSEATDFNSNDYTMIVQGNASKKISKENMLNGLAEQSELNELKGQILWTNPNPTSAIASPTVINLEDYDCDILECFYKNSLNSTLRYSTRFLKGYDTRLQILTTDTVLFFRGLNYVSDTSYRIELPYYTGTISNPNELCIPLYIIGYKTGLFN